MNNNELQKKILDLLISTSSDINTPMREADIAGFFNVSLAPIREALSNLEEKGFVERRKKKGTYLRYFSLKEMNEIYDLRSVMEGLATKLLCGLATPSIIERLKELAAEYTVNEPSRNISVLSDIDYRFHSLIVDSCRNERLKGLVTDFHLITKTMKYAVGEKGLVRLFKNPYSHSRIVNAIENHDYEEAELSAKKHVELAKENTIREMIAEGVASYGHGERV